MRIFFTGHPGSGKSTVLTKATKILKQKGLKVGGIITPEIRKGNRRIGFAVKDVYSGEEGILASVESKTGVRFGRYKIDVKDFESVAIPALDFAMKECDIIAIDEIGKMEFFSIKFKQKLQEVLESEKPLIAVLHRTFVNQFRKYGKVIEVTFKNREKLPEEILKEFLKLSGPTQN